MNLHVMSVRDRATDSFGNPMFFVAVGQGVRAFTDEVNKRSPDNGLNMHPEDYDLYVLGTFNTDTGLFEVGVPRMVTVGKDVFNAPE